MQKVGALQILGIVAFFGLALAVHLWRTSPRSGASRPVIGGTLSIDCTSQRGERLEGRFELDRCRQD